MIRGAGDLEVLAIWRCWRCAEKGDGAEGVSAALWKEKDCEGWCAVQAAAKQTEPGYLGEEGAAWAFWGARVVIFNHLT